MGIMAVIFDLDGVLIDTERLAFEAWQKELSALGYFLGEDDYQAMIGLDAEQTVLYTEKKFGLTSGASTLPEHSQVMLSILDGELEPVPGATDLIFDLKQKGYDLAVASNSRRDYVLKTLTSLRLVDAFTVCIGREQVQAGKPAPDVYLAAAAELGLPTAQCLAIEDSLVGVKAALAAGMYCIAIPTGNLPRSEFGIASVIFNSLSSLNIAFDKLVRSQIA